MKKIFFTGLLLAVFMECRAQKANWQNLDLEKDGVPGISTERAYKELLRHKESKTVLVAIIDSGVDTTHQDLKPVLWKNIQETPGNGNDDDRNGYIDDVYGWNFSGIPVPRDTIVNLINRKQAFFDSLSYTKVPETLRGEYERFGRLRKMYNTIAVKLESTWQAINEDKRVIDKLVQATGKINPGTGDFKKLLESTTVNRGVLRQVIDLLPLYKDYADFKSKAIDTVQHRLRYVLDHLYSPGDSAGVAAAIFDASGNVSYDSMFAIPNSNDFFHDQPFAFHGTHIAGIIGAVRTNNTGIKGVADNVRIMNLKIYSGLFPVFRDESLAAAIRYATDNGARVINLSLAQKTSDDRFKIESAVRYAMSKNVLIIRAAGNSGRDMNSQQFDEIYPNKYYAAGKGEAPAWLTVGASGWRDNDTLAAKFSNYGVTAVDVFAPGVSIDSTIPGNRYQKFNGTSMAAPVVVGLAALLMEYYPKLTAVQVKEIIMRSVNKVDHNVYLPGNSAVKTKVPFSSLCVSGGIVNAYNALKLAATY